MSGEKSEGKKKFSLLIQGETVECHVLLRKRSKQVKLRVRSARQLEIVLPAPLPQKEIDRILFNQRTWILKQTKKIAIQQKEEQQFQPIKKIGKQLQALYQGVYYPLPDKIGLQFSDSSFRLTDKKGSVYTAQEWGDMLEVWYREEADQVIAQRVEIVNQQLGYQYNLIRVKDQKSRWGSCSSQGNLHFNWRLILAPVAVLDYVILHELTHLREFSHSAAFWKIVSYSCVDFGQHRLWLKQYGGALLAFNR